MKQSVRIKTAFLALFSLIVLTTIAQTPENFDIFFDCAYHTTKVYNFENIIDPEVYDTNCINETLKRNIATNLYKRPLLSYEDTLAAIAGIMYGLDCQINVSNKRLELYKKMKKEIKELYASVSPIKFDSILFHSEKELTPSDKQVIIGSDLIFYGEVIAERVDLLGRRTFLSEYLIKVDSVLYSCNNVSKGSIVLVKRYNGVENSNDEPKRDGDLKLWRILGLEKKLKIGDNQLFLLSNVQYLSKITMNNVLSDHKDEYCLGFYLDVTTLLRYPEKLMQKDHLIYEFIIQNY